MKLEDKIKPFLSDLCAFRTIEKIEYEGNWAAGDAPSDPIEYVHQIEVPDFRKRAIALKDIIKTVCNHYTRRIAFYNRLYNRPCSK